MASNVLAIVGTRPEVIKMAPVLRGLRRRDVLVAELCVVHQQRAVLDAALAEWGLEPDWRVDPTGGRPVAPTVGPMIAPLQDVIRASCPEVVLVQGDTTTALAGALAAAREGIEIAHIEAGLRSGRLDSPFPEEIHRHVVDRLSAVLYAPTDVARENLLREGLGRDRIRVVGNTVIDALDTVLAELGPPPARSHRRLSVLCTAHRRESFGEALVSICGALRDVLEARPSVDAHFVLHPNPRAHAPVRHALDGQPRARLSPPMGYRSFVAAMQHADLILTDSGGIQEEAPWLGKPLLVIRDETERVEAVLAGASRVIGRTRSTIAAHMLDVLDALAEGRLPTRRTAPFGGPGAASRICDDLETRCSLYRCA